MKWKLLCQQCQSECVSNDRLQFCSDDSNAIYLFWLFSANLETNVKCTKWIIFDWGVLASILSGWIFKTQHWQIYLTSDLGSLTSSHPLYPSLDPLNLSDIFQGTLKLKKNRTVHPRLDLLHPSDIFQETLIHNKN